MGRKFGGINAHLEETARAVSKWLEYENKPAGVEHDATLSLLFIATDTSNEPTPEQPHALTLLRQSRRFGVPIFSGSLMEWPHIARLELNTVVNAEDDHSRLAAFNLKLKALAK